MSRFTHLRLALISVSILLVTASRANASSPAALPTSTSVVPLSPTATAAPDRTGGYMGFVGAQGLEARDFPAELTADSPEIDANLAVNVATNFVNNSRIVVGRDVLIDFCDDGKGTTLAFSVANAFVNQPIRWAVEPNEAEGWNHPKIIIKFDDPELDIPGFHLELVVQAPVNDVMPSWFPSGAGGQTTVFDNPDCGK